jgi:hypothetical protein
VPAQEAGGPLVQFWEPQTVSLAALTPVEAEAPAQP